MHPHLLLSAVDEEPGALDLLEGLLAWLASTSTEDKLAPEPPLLGDLPVLSGLLINDGVVMLKVGAEAFGLESSPESELVHGVGVL
jgi:hypothetical protein